MTCICRLSNVYNECKPICECRNCQRTWNLCIRSWEESTETAAKHRIIIIMQQQRAWRDWPAYSDIQMYVPQGCRPARGVVEDMVLYGSRRWKTVTEEIFTNIIRSIIKNIMKTSFRNINIRNGNSADIRVKVWSSQARTRLNTAAVPAMSSDRPADHLTISANTGRLPVVFLPVLCLDIISYQ